jgi:hypothetical protein
MLAVGQMIHFIFPPCLLRYSSSQSITPDARNEYIQLTDGYFDNIWCGDAEEVIKAFATITKPWLATKVLAAGAIDPRSGLTYALEGGADFAAVAMFDFLIATNAQTVKRIIPRADKKRSRQWQA